VEIECCKTERMCKRLERKTKRNKAKELVSKIFIEQTFRFCVMQLVLYFREKNASVEIYFTDTV
jgi:hypothetical protein